MMLASLHLTRSNVLGSHSFYPAVTLMERPKCGEDAPVASAISPDLLDRLTNEEWSISPTPSISVLPIGIQVSQHVSSISRVTAKACALQHRRTISLENS
jgi:hypothetical protein